MVQSIYQIPGVNAGLDAGACPRIPLGLPFRKSWQALGDIVMLSGQSSAVAGEQETRFRDLRRELDYPRVKEDPDDPSAPLSFSRRHWNRRDFLSLSELNKCGFIFNRRARLSDLGDVSPLKPDRFDVLNYRKEGNLWVSRHNPRFILVDMDKIDDGSITAMLGLDRCFVMRTTLHGKSVSVYLMGDHTWALWGWVEAAARGEIFDQGNVLIHADAHSDLRTILRLIFLKEWGIKLNLANVDLVIDEHVKVAGDMRGIASFIGPAAVTGFIDEMYWTYWFGQGSPRGIVFDLHESDRSMFSRGSLACRSDYFWMEVRGSVGDAPRILDVDQDIGDGVDEMLNAVGHYFEVPGWADCITIAITPEYGPRENHLEKTRALLRTIRDNR